MTGQLDDNVDARLLTLDRSVAQVDPYMVYANKHASLLLDRLSSHGLTVVHVRSYKPNE